MEKSWGSGVRNCHGNSDTPRENSVGGSRFVALVAENWHIGARGPLWGELVVKKIVNWKDQKVAAAKEQREGDAAALQSEVKVKQKGPGKQHYW